MSLNPHIDWETNIGGEGNDVPAAVVNHGTHFHVLVVTNSTRYDFVTDDEAAAGQAQRLFLARLSPSGRTMDFVLLDSGSNISVVTAMAWGGDTLVLYNVGNNSFLRRFNHSGGIVHSFGSPNRRGVDLMVDNRGGTGRLVLAVRHDRSPFASTLTLYVLNENLALDPTAPQHTMTTDGMPRSLDYVAIFPAVADAGRYIVFAIDEVERHPAIIEFGAGFNPVYHSLRFAALPNFVITDVVPYSDGGIGVFIMAGIANGAPHLITVRHENGIFASHTLTPLAEPLGISGATDTKFLLADSGEGAPYKYVMTVNEGGSAVRRLLPNSASLAPQANFGALNNVAFVADFILSRPNLPANARETLLLGTDTGGNLFLTRLMGDTAIRLLTFGGSGIETAVAMTPSGGGVIIVSATTSAPNDIPDGDVGGNFGGVDTWIAFVPL